MLRTSTEASLSRLKRAIRENKIDSIKTLIYDEKVSVSALDSNGFAALHYATVKGDLTIFKMVSSCLEKKEDINIEDTTDHYTPLMIAVAYEKQNICDYICDTFNVDVNATSLDKNNSPLYVAVIKNNLKMLKWLKEKGVKNDNAIAYLALGLATRECKIEALKYLLSELKISVTKPISSRIGISTLHVAALKNLKTFRLVASFLEKPEDIHTESKEGLTCFMYAVANEKTDICDFIYDNYKIDVNAISQGGMSAAQAATLQGKINMLKWLKNKGLNLKDNKKMGGLALRAALRKKYRETAAYLIGELGASMHDLPPGTFSQSNVSKADLDAADAEYKLIAAKLTSTKPAYQDKKPDSLESMIENYKKLLSNKKRIKFNKQLKQISTLNEDTVKALYDKITQENTVATEVATSQPSLQLQQATATDPYQEWEKIVSQNDYLECDRLSDGKIKLYKREGTSDKKIQLLLDNLADIIASDKYNIKCRSGKDHLIFEDYRKIKAKTLLHLINTEYEKINISAKQKTKATEAIPALDTQPMSLNDNCIPLTKKPEKTVIKIMDKDFFEEKPKENKKPSVESKKQITIDVVFSGALTTETSEPVLTSKSKEEIKASPAKQTLTQAEIKKIRKAQQQRKEKLIENAFHCIGNMILTNDFLEEDEKSDTGLKPGVLRATKHFSALYYLLRCSVLLRNANLDGQKDQTTDLRNMLVHGSYLLIEKEKFVSDCVRDLKGKKLPPGSLKYFEKQQKQRMQRYVAQDTESKLIITDTAAYEALEPFFLTQETTHLTNLEEIRGKLYKYLNAIMPSIKKICGGHWQQGNGMVERLHSQCNSQLTAISFLLFTCGEIAQHLLALRTLTLRNSEIEFLKLCQPLRNEIVHRDFLNPSIGKMLDACQKLEEFSNDADISDTCFAKPISSSETKLLAKGSMFSTTKVVDVEAKIEDASQSFRASSV